jgi:DNA topoisomerase-1
VATTLIIAEKPDAALHIAEALCTSGEPRKRSQAGVPFFEVQRGEERILVCSAVGHLYTVASKNDERRSEYPVWDFLWKPKHFVERGRVRQEKCIQSITELSKISDRFVNGCDFDVEGSLIGYVILKYACNGADKVAKRMKFSTLTAKELREAYVRAMPALDFSLAYAGMCRHEVDWLYGINLSRALTQSALKASKRYSTLSTGRVQGPTLRFVVEREREIGTFVPHPYWLLQTTVDIDGKLFEVEHERERFDVMSQAERAVADCAGKDGVVEGVESRTYSVSPPTPFDLSALQADAYRHFGLTPRVTLGLAERLYLDQLISYPRTSSQKLPPSIGYEEVLRGLGIIEPYRSFTQMLLAGVLVPNEGRKEDPAHPAVYPTGTVPKRSLEPREQKVFDLIVRRFLSTFGKPATKQSDKAIIKVDKHAFFLRGSRVLEKGWTLYYGPYAKTDDVILPPLKRGQHVHVTNIRLQDKYTQPPPRYNPGSLLKEMEDAEIGTKATRADILETLYKRGYVKEQRMIATPLASTITEILSKFCPKVIDVKFTRELETKMQQIELGKMSRENVVVETVNYLKPIIDELKAKENEIGKELTSIVGRRITESITLLSPCPKCGSSLRIVRSPRTKKRFIGCAGKWKTNCVFALPLPQFGALTLLNKRCAECGFQLVQVRARGRRPLISCPRCYATRQNATKVEAVTMSPLDRK